MEKELEFHISKENLEEITNCPICDSNNTSIINNVENNNGLVFFQTNFCNQCSFVYRSIRPTKNWFSNAFSLREEYQKNLNFSAINPKIEEERFNRYFRLGEEIKSLLKISNPNEVHILDVGCGTGSGLLAFIEIGFKTFGLDEDNTRAAYGIDKGLEIFVQSWETFEPKTKFDLITCLHSIEHFHDPSQLMKKLRTWLNPGGKIVIEVPNFKHFVVDWTDSLYLAHMANYSPINLVKLAQKCGMNFIERVHHYQTETKNNENLCMIFELGSGENSSDFNQIGFGDEMSLENVIDLYKKGLPTSEFTFETNSFVVPNINDISLCYKNSNRVSENLSENLHMRSISIKNEKFFIH